MSELLTRSEIDATVRPLDEARCLPGRIYYDQDIYDAEMERIFKREWVAVLMAAKLPNRGDYTTMELAGTPLMFVRDAEGDIRCHINVCRHRGMQVASGEGNKRVFECPYHRWAYNHAGELVGAPEMPEMIGCTRLPEVRTAVWHGVVFINFRDDAPDLHHQLSELGKILEPWNADELEILYDKPYECDWNWKIMFENGSECYHILGTHRLSLEDNTPTHDCYGAPGDGRNYTEFHMPFDTSQGDLFSEDSAVAPLPGLPSWANEKYLFWSVYPNLIINQTPDGLQFYIVIPHGPQKSTFTWTYLTKKDAKNDPNYEKFKRTQEDFADIVQGEDEVCCRPVQVSMNSGYYEPGPYNQRELPIWAFHRWYINRIAEASQRTSEW
ncbi:aromatic ring-hydroxylating dioxygenase subunit alpha [Nocardia cyriacigeorgica]|uniref:Aromatic ring-hydroxylating dioxygenase subunit alpha n=1 Tax=Nocardia cyriacigeorgica TaxID=135487 RepID=A0A6P1D6J7_9NOCA|nr:aromatic ring-hydroxylating dioxygenase subunit alpha [Nocardia cyriacigeorgica]NEW45688.1 aromatic ring-hydroxylating dioxygenase subunit alpha [Nocardia cyriacigeorgica]NEW55403.1 aromatic ring-hydroxylating dioxygenase subunit alpha [Nocardia cyriacigeorgica]